MTASRSGPPADPAGPGRLHDFYEHPGTTVSSGPDRGRRPAQMLAAALAQRSGPQQIVDIGCGGGSAPHLVKRLDPRNTVIVVMSELIEHLVDTDAAVEEARRILRPGGILLLSTPNLAACRGCCGRWTAPCAAGRRWPASCSSRPGAAHERARPGSARRGSLSGGLP